MLRFPICFIQRDVDSPIERTFPRVLRRVTLVGSMYEAC
jgi:hypothetical protein